MCGVFSFCLMIVSMLHLSSPCFPCVLTCCSIHSGPLFSSQFHLAQLRLKHCIGSWARLLLTSQPRCKWNHEDIGNQQSLSLSSSSSPSSSGGLFRRWRLSWSLLESRRWTMSLSNMLSLLLASWTCEMLTRDELCREMGCFWVFCLYQAFPSQLVFFAQCHCLPTPCFFFLLRVWLCVPFLKACFWLIFSILIA